MAKKSLLILSGALLLSSCSTFFQIANISPSASLKELSHSNDTPNPLYEFFYSDTLENAYLREMRKTYNLEGLVSGPMNELDKIVNILDWASKQWEHNGSNTPTKQDALTILKEAQEGKIGRAHV